MSVVEKVTECAACGGPIVTPVMEEFCSTSCFKAGRIFCKFCGEPIPQPKGGKKFCRVMCRRRYRNLGGPISRSWLEERNRSTCKVCNKPITQPKYGRKWFCSGSCGSKYRETKKRGQELLQDWGSFAPEVRRSLREVQLHMGIGAAKRLAAAINREYNVRREVDPGSTLVTCHCKTCGKEFKRFRSSNQSRDYCSPGHNPRAAHGRVTFSGEMTPSAKLTWEQVDEIRCLYATGDIPQRKLAKKYGITQGSVRHIIHYRTWKPEQDPRRKSEVSR